MPTAPKRYSPLGIRDAGARRDHTYTSSQRGYGREWYRRTEAWIAEQVQIDARCRICGSLPLPTKRRKKRLHDVDHKIPPSSAGPPGSAAYQRMFWDENNWQLTCPPCNASKQNRHAGSAR